MFKRVDDQAYEEDRPLDTFLLKRVEGNIEAARQARGQIATYTPGVVDTSSGAQLRWRVCSYRQRAICPMLWYKSPGLTHVEIIARQQSPSSVSAGAFEVRYSAFAINADSIGRSAAPVSSVSLDLAGGAAAPSNDKLVLDVSGLATGWIIIGVCYESGESAVSSVCAASAFTGYYTGYYVADIGASAVLGTSTDWPCIAVALKESAGKASTFEPALAYGRQVLRHNYNGGGGDYVHTLHVYPPIPTSGSDSGTFGVRTLHNAGTDTLFKVDLGYVDVHSITLRDHTITAAAGSTGLLDAGQATSTAAARHLIRFAHRTWLERPRVHSIGPPPNTNDLDLTGTGGVSRAGNSISITSSYQEIGRALTARGNEFEAGGVSYTRTQITIAALVLYTHTRGDLDREIGFDIDVRVELLDPNGVTASVTLEESAAVYAYPAAPILDYRGLGEAAARLTQGLIFGNNTANTPRRTTLTGLILDQDFGRLKPQVILLTLKDTQAPAAARAASLQLRSKRYTSSGAAIDVDGNSHLYNPRAHLIAVKVLTTPHVQDLPIAADIGIL